jgi:hypothetical protein
MRKVQLLICYFLLVKTNVSAQPTGSVYYLDSITQAGVLSKLQKTYINKKNDTSHIEVLFVRFGIRSTKGCIIYSDGNRTWGYRIAISNKGAIRKKKLSIRRIEQEGISYNYLSKSPLFLKMEPKLWCTGTSVNDDRYFFLYKGGTVVESVRYSLRCIMFNSDLASAEANGMFNNLAY